MSNVHNHKITCKNARRFCKEDISLIENYEAMMADTTQKWCCHHRREIDENKSRQQLIDEELYYKRPASELIFMTFSAHRSLHTKNNKNPMFGHSATEYMSDDQIEQWKQNCPRYGEKNGNFGKTWKFITNGKINKRLYDVNNLPSGWEFGLTRNSRK